MYRISDLIKLDRKLFHTNDLAILWGITNRHTLYMAITRYIDKEVLFPVYKGLYATVPVSALNPEELGPAIIHRYTYLSTETILAQAGVISQNVYDITYVSSISKKISVGRWSFRYRRLRDAYLHNPSGLIHQEGLFRASIERAVADMLYFSPKYEFDVPQNVDFEKVKSIQKEVGYRC